MQMEHPLGWQSAVGPGGKHSRNIPTLLSWGHRRRTNSNDEVRFFGCSGSLPSDHQSVHRSRPRQPRRVSASTTTGHDYRDDRVRSSTGLAVPYREGRDDGEIRGVACEPYQNYRITAIVPWVEPCLIRLMRASPSCTGFNEQNGQSRSRHGTLADEGGHIRDCPTTESRSVLRTERGPRRQSPSRETVEPPSAFVRAERRVAGSFPRAKRRESGAQTLRDRRLP
jgi:hypothetical protein